MTGPGLESNLDFLDSVLALYLSKRQGMMSNELVRNTYEFEKLCRKKVAFKGGKRLEFDTLLRRSNIGGFSSAWKVRQVEQRQHNVRGIVDWSVYENSIELEDIENLLSAGDGEIFELEEERLEACRTEAWNDLESAMWDPVGNGDKLAAQDPPFAGLKYWVTRDGYNVDGTASVANVSVANDPRWANRFCGPIGSNLNVNGANGAGALDAT